MNLVGLPGLERPLTKTVQRLMLHRHFTENIAYRKGVTMKATRNAYPILFSGELVRAIIVGRKTQTRRLTGGRDDRRIAAMTAGDLLWGRETWAIDASLNDKAPSDINPHRFRPRIFYKADNILYTMMPEVGRWRASIHMPRWASRMMLRLTADPWRERLQEITPLGALAEGVRQDRLENGRMAIERFQRLWDAVCPMRDGTSFGENPEVWVFEFEYVEIRP
jgi:hypothetical protein